MPHSVKQRPTCPVSHWRLTGCRAHGRDPSSKQISDGWFIGSTPFSLGTERNSGQHLGGILTTFEFLIEDIMPKSEFL